MEDGETDIFFPSLIDNHYPNRPSELKDICLYDFAAKYDIVTSKPKTDKAKFYNYGKLFVKERTKARIINHTNKEEYYFALLLLFKPFKKQAELLGTHKSYEEAYESCKQTLKDAEEYHNKMQTLHRARTSLDEQLKELDLQDKEADEDEGESNSQN